VISGYILIFCKPFLTERDGSSGKENKKTKPWANLNPMHFNKLLSLRIKTTKQQVNHCHNRLYILDTGESIWNEILPSLANTGY